MSDYDTPENTPQGNIYSKPEQDFDAIARMLMNGVLQNAGLGDADPQTVQGVGNSFADAMQAIAESIRQNVQPPQAQQQSMPNFVDARGNVDFDSLGDLSQDQARAIRSSPMFGQLGRNAQQMVGRIASGKTFEVSGKTNSDSDNPEDATAQLQQESPPPAKPKQQVKPDNPSQPEEIQEEFGNTIFRTPGEIEEQTWKMQEDDWKKLVDDMRLPPPAMQETDGKHDDDENILALMGQKFEEEKKFRRLVIDLFRMVISDNANDNAELNELRRMLEQSRTAL